MKCTPNTSPAVRKLIKREILRARILLAAMLAVAAAAGALGFQLYHTHGLVPALVTVAGILLTVVIVEES